MTTETSYYFSWVRKGLSNYITEVDVLGHIKNESLLAKQRPVLFVTSEYELTPISPNDEEKRKEIIVSDTKEIDFISAGDILKVHENAILKTTPTSNNIGFPIQYLPYVEFWEADFPWRYTPAKHNNNRLRPWLALLVCEKAYCRLTRLSSGQSTVSFQLESEEQYQQVFPHPETIWRSAHAQGSNEKEPELSRLIALRMSDTLNPNTDYYAFLVPTFEIGRLRGLGYGDEELAKITAQASAWEVSLAKQKNQHSKRPLDFPVYYSWSFKTGNDSFDGLVEKLSIAKTSESGIPIDVTKMGEGIDYTSLTQLPDRKTIIIPAATQTIGQEKPASFPDPTNKNQEEQLYERLKDLLSKNPVFLENKFLLSDSEEGQAENTLKDDPWVVPPAYGAKHSMASSIDETENQKNNTPWVSQINLDLHYRAVAGLGKKTIQIHQEELVNRAWKQVEAIQALNRELYQRLLSVNANKSLRNKTFSTFDRSSANFIANFMQYFHSMKSAMTEDEHGNPQTSLEQILKDSNIPQAFATASFQHLTKELARLIGTLDPTSLMQNIAEQQIFKAKEHTFHNLPTLAQITHTTDIILLALIHELNHQYLKPFLAIKDLEFIVPSCERRPELENRFIFSRQNLYLSNSPDLNKDNNTSTIPAQHLQYYYNFFKENESRFNYGSDSDKYYEMMGVFLEKGLHRHSFYGYAGNNISSTISSAQAIRVPDKLAMKNVIGLDDEIYKFLFGSKKTITRLGGEDGLYFVCKNMLLDAYRTTTKDLTEANLQESINVYIQFLKYPKFGAPVSIRMNDALSKNSDDYRYSYGFGRSSTSYNVSACYHPTLYESLLDGPTDMWDNEGNDLRDKISKTPQYAPDISENKKKRYDDYQKEITNYLLNTPDYITIDTEKLADNNLQAFDSVYAYAQFLKQSKDPHIFPYLRAWQQLESKINELKKLKDEIDAEKKVKESDEVIKAIDEKDIKDLHAGLENNETYERMRQVAVAYYSEFFDDTKTGKKLRDRYIEELLHSKYPILAYPIFPEPVYHYLKLFSDKFIIPSVDAIPDNSVAVFKSDTSFVEAYLCGMNTEMGRELLWREFPTDQRGSYFRKFWDSETDGQSIRSDNFFDVTPLHTWSGALGDNHAESKTGLLLFAIKGKLMQQFPSTQVFLHKASGDKKRKRVDFDNQASLQNEGIILPVIQAHLRDDIYLVGFKKEFDALLGNPAADDYGYILAFEENVQDLNFEYNAQKHKEFMATNNAADAAKALRNDPSLYGKHLSLFIIQ